MFDICNQFRPSNISLPFYGNYFIKFSRFYSPIHECLIPFIVFFGLLSNASLLVVLTRKKMISATNIFLIGMSVADSCVLISYFCIFIPLVKFKFGSYEYSYTFTQILPVYIIYRGASSLLTVLLALWRVTSLYFPFQSKIKLNERNAVIGTLICFGLCQILFIPQTVSFMVDTKNCSIEKGNQTFNKNVYNVS